jgi:hypothetical protein
MKIGYFAASVLLLAACRSEPERRIRQAHSEMAAREAEDGTRAEMAAPIYQGCWLISHKQRWYVDLGHPRADPQFNRQVRLPLGRFELSTRKSTTRPTPDFIARALDDPDSSDAAYSWTPREILASIAHGIMIKRNGRRDGTQATIEIGPLAGNPIGWTQVLIHGPDVLGSSSTLQATRLNDSSCPSASQVRDHPTSLPPVIPSFVTGDSVLLNLAAGCYEARQTPLGASPQSLFKLPMHIELLTDSAAARIVRRMRPDQLLWRDARLVVPSADDSSHTYRFAQAVWWHTARDSIAVVSGNCCSGIRFQLHRTASGWEGSGYGHYDVGNQVDSATLRLIRRPCPRQRPNHDL